MEFPAYLATMPMHAITEIHGEPGLLARFRLEIRAFDDAAQKRLTEALDLAADLHRDDRRVREPYLNHLLRVVIRMMHHYQVRDVDVIVAGLLHDAVEDHPAELAGLDLRQLQLGAPTAAQRPGADAGDPTAAALATLADRFGPRVARLVGAVTNPVYDPGRDRHVQYREHVAASLDREPWARVIKVSDFTDNGVGVIHTVGPKVARSAAKYRPLVPVFRDLIARPDTPLSAPVKQHIFAQLDLAEERFSAILDHAN
ncbi:HD domain-containing protein [Micromonospora sp. DR5-3]|uniref:HD domain-containing protein n=1 Tax=unclassified Micromonospora TaxID=2617518 RepID=UPI0011D4A914|nr:MULTISPECIES: HD domain-containing protein [unclassified Micromonospora]MCW3816965.1 HD domain-containing protein [Micromonospora sp. DR5-3]TYC23457.1 HD domain-containing protein [Micromonospora sp. MP36]